MSPDADDALIADRPAVIDETFDGEAVLVHLGTGRYYALNEAASEIWVLVRDGGRTADVAELVAASHTEEEGRLATEFIEELVREGLVVSAAPAARGQLENGDTSRGPWREPPKMQTFDDLQDLLLVDPIHDVTLGPDGWPVGAGQ